jgi:hypothetical protein
MNRPWSRWAPVIGVLFSVVIAIGAYNLGVARGIAQHTPVTPVGAYPGPWPHPWGFGWFFFPLFLFGWFFVLRVLFWGGRRGWHGGRGGHYRGQLDVPPAFEEWHRRAHAGDRVDSGLQD